VASKYSTTHRLVFIKQKIIKSKMSVEVENTEEDDD
jgi:hypothetical protein